MKYLYEYEMNELKHIMEENTFKTFRAKQIYNWLYNGGINDIEEMKNIPKNLKLFLKENFIINPIQTVQKQEDKDADTIKYLLKLPDDNMIECVLIKSGDRKTICISSQVGCPLNCSFCSTATMGFIRNLTAGEIVGQFQLLKMNHQKLDNIVFMGMGEPMLNYENVAKAIRIINNKNGLNFGIKRITLSTAGVVKGIQKLTEDKLNIKLAVSLNSPIEQQRIRLMPVTKTNSLGELIKALKLYQETTGKRITFEYVMIKNENMDKKHAEKIIDLKKELNFNLNIIPYNDSLNTSLKTPNSQDIERFLSYFVDTDIEIVRRYKKGNNINAACGQLAVKNIKT